MWKNRSRRSFIGLSLGLNSQMDDQTPGGVFLP